MNYPFTPERFPNIFELCLSAGDGKCISWAPSKGRRCQNPACAADRPTAAYFQQQIAAYIIRPTCRIDQNDLRRFVVASCCKRNHQGVVEKEPVLEPLIREWWQQIAKYHRHREAATRQSQPVAASVASPSSSRGALPSIASGNRRILLIADVASSSEAPASPPLQPPAFSPYEDLSHGSISEALLEPLQPSERKSGQLFGVSKASDPEYIKCKSTLNHLEQRQRDFKACAGPNNAITVHFSIDTENVRRAETLAHLQLQKDRYREARCRGCRREHNDWFKLSARTLQKTATQWAQWMNVAKPYDDRGRLREPCKRHIRDLEREGTVITASELLYAWLTDVSGEEYDDHDDDTISTDSDTRSVSSSSSSVSSEDGDDDCPICLDSMSERATTSCGHHFCCGCIAKVFSTSNRCPLCRAELVEGGVSEADLAEAEIPMQNADRGV